MIRATYTQQIPSLQQMWANCDGAYTTIKSSCSTVIDEACHVMADIPTMDGLVQWSKFAISALRLVMAPFAVNALNR